MQAADRLITAAADTIQLLISDIKMMLMFRQS